MLLDVRTTYVMTACCFVVVAASLWVARRQCGEVSGLLQWAWGFAAIAGGIAAFAVGALSSTVYLLSIGNVSLVYGMLLLVDGARRHMDQPRVSMRAQVACLVGALLAFLLTAQDSAGALVGRKVVLAGLGAPLLGMLAHSFLAGGSRRHPLRIIVGTAAAVEALFLVARAAIVVVLPELGDPLGWFEMLSLVQSFVVVQVIGLGFLMLTAQRFQAELLRQASIDPLTQLFNRRSFYKAATALLSKSLRSGTPLSVMVVDIDHFKAVNDRFGHPVGDRVLQTFAEAARAVFGERDLVGRFGGEEFVVVLPNVGLSCAVTAAQRLRAVFRDTLVEARILVEPADDRPHPVTLSVGVAEWAADGEELDGAIHRADTAMYAAKAAGRDRVCSAPPATTAWLPERGAEKGAPSSATSSSCAPDVEC